MAYMLAADFEGAYSDVNHRVDLMTPALIYSTPHCLSYTTYARENSVFVRSYSIFLHLAMLPIRKIQLPNAGVA